MRNDPVTEITDMTSDKRTATIRINHITDKEGNNFVNSPYLGSVAINTAEARMGSDKNALYQGVSVYHYDKDNASITVDVSVTGTNSKWLCIDGCNKMEANLAFDNTKPVNAREIQDVSNIKMNNSGTAVISNANNLQIQSNAQMQSIASNILNSASNNFEATATNQAYVGGNVAKLVGNAQSVVASGSQQVTIDPSQIVLLEQLLPIM